MGAVDFADDKEAILHLYNESLREHGLTPRGITWGSRQSQDVRFAALCGVGDLGGKSVLDFGCGFGDLYGYFQERGTKPATYLGVDINPTLIGEAKKRYPGGHFAVTDIFATPMGTWDYALASGALGIDTPHWEEMTHAILCKLFAATTYGIAVNFLTTHAPSRTGSHYVDPVDMFNYAVTHLSRWVTIRQDYKDNDFTLYVYHGPAL